MLSIFYEVRRVQSIFIYIFILQFLPKWVKVYTINCYMCIRYMPSSHKTYYIQAIINSPRMFEIAEGCIPFLIPLPPLRNASCSSRFLLLAVICPRHRQLPNIYVVVMQHLQHFLQCRFVRVFASKPHINIHCKQIISGCKT